MTYCTDRRSRRPRFAALPLAVVALLAAACGDRAPEPPEPATPSPAVVVPEKLEPRNTGPRPKVVALGDSLTAGYGLSKSDSYPMLLQRMLDEQGYNYEVVNAGVSGDTTAGGVRRIDRALQGDVEVVIVALGGNDALRGLPVGDMKRNLETIVGKATARGATVVLAGMEAPPYLGAEYTAEFREVFREVGSREGVHVIPFFLEGVAGRAELNQVDGIHPNQAGTRLVAERIFREVAPLLAR